MHMQKEEFQKIKINIDYEREFESNYFIFNFIWMREVYLEIF